MTIRFANPARMPLSGTAGLLAAAPAKFPLARGAHAS